MKLSKIKPNPSNPRTIRDDKFNKLVKSIQQFPAMMEKRPIVVDETMTVLGGNMRLRALQHIYGKSGDIPDNWVTVAQDWTEEQKREFVIKDNAAFGEWDWDALAQDFNADDLADWGIDIPVPEDATEIPTGDVKDDGFDPEQPVETVCKKGDIWKLGDHRLMCGDSTDSGSVALLMDGERADIAFTSPPYNLMEGFNTHPSQKGEYLMGRNAYEEYEDDLTSEDYASFLTKTLENCLISADDVFFNIGYTKGSLIGTALFLGENAQSFCGAITWVKSGAFMPFLPTQHGMLGNITEPVYIFSKEAGRKLHHPQWKQGEVSYNIVETKNASGNEFSKIHAATFPIEFASEFISRFSNKSVFDCFGGTGTTLIAAEQLNRRCYMMELDPHYCDVIIARWEKLTGRKAEKITDGMDV